jgi:nucleotide-binding universal stress UspA family protein
MKILLAVDESCGSEDAVTELEERSWALGTMVRVLHVVEKFVPPAAGLWYDAGGNLDGAHDEVASRSKEPVERMAERLRAGGLEVETVVKDGKAGECIVAEAKDWNADLIVLGSHDHRPILRALMGSVTRYVEKHAPCLVEVVHRKRTA